MVKANDPLLNKINNYKKRVNKHISLNRDRINVLKKIQDKYNIPHNFTNREKKGKSFHSKNKFTNKTKSSEIPKKFEVESVLKNLQEKIKNSIILRPEDLKFDEDLVPNRRRSKAIKEKGISKFSKKNIKSFRPSQVNDKKTPLNETEIESLNITFKKELENKNHKSTKKNLDLFKDSQTTKRKNDSEIDDLKTKFNEDINFNGIHESEKNNINIGIHKEKYRIMIRKKLIYDSLDDEEVDDGINDYFYINPESNFSLVFDSIVLFVSIYSFIYFPYYLAHSLSFCRENFFSFHRLFNTFIEIIYILDFIFGFFQAYYNFEEQLIKKHSSIIKKYLTGWFIFDLVSAIPVYSILKFKETKCDGFIREHYYSDILNNINYLFLFNRVLKVFKSISCNHF